MSARIIPIGGLVFISGIFNASAAYSEYKVTPLPDWLWPCDGSQITDLTSPIAGKYTPNIASRLLRSRAGGNYGDDSFIFVGEQNTESYDGIEENAYYRYSLRVYMRIK